MDKINIFNSFNTVPLIGVTVSLISIGALLSYSIFSFSSSRAVNPVGTKEGEQLYNILLNLNKELQVLKGTLIRNTSDNSFLLEQIELKFKLISEAIAFLSKRNMDSTHIILSEISSLHGKIATMTNQESILMGSSIEVPQIMTPELSHVQGNLDSLIAIIHRGLTTPPSVDVSLSAAETVIRNTETVTGILNSSIQHKNALLSFWEIAGESSLLFNYFPKCAALLPYCSGESLTLGFGAIAGQVLIYQIFLSFPDIIRKQTFLELVPKLFKQ